MPKSSFVDFKTIKAAITMEQVLEHYGLMDKFKRGTDSLNGPCPIHRGSNPTQFRISLSKNIWNCFSKCKGGNVLDFIAKMEDASIHAAALKAMAAGGKRRGWDALPTLGAVREFLGERLPADEAAGLLKRLEVLG